MRVLLVDDDPSGLELRRMVLERCGHEVTLAADTHAARACLAASPDVVLMDLRLPRVDDGLALLRELHQATPATPVVVLSGYHEDLEGRAERAFASEILPKPVRTERLLEALARVG